MSCHIEHRKSLPWPDTAVYQALIDKDYLAQRLRAIGGPGAELIAHDRSGERTVIQIKQVVDASYLPTAARSFLGGNAVVNRTETWQNSELSGVFKATIDKVPGQLDGSFKLTKTNAGCHISLVGTVKVGIPIIGGKLESLIAEQITKLIDQETEFTNRWLDNHA